MRVGIAGSPPFNMSQPGKPSGISVDIWKELAGSVNLVYKIQSFNSVADLLTALKANKIDVAIGPISITSERYKEVAFTQPYYRSSISILTKRGSPSLWSSIKPFIQKTFLLAVSTLMVVLFIVDNLIWLLERGKNPDFSESYWAGVGNGMWLAVVTFTTVGYGDLAPVTRLGRMLVGIWMIVALIPASSLTAGIASSFTLLSLQNSAIKSPDDLRDKKVAVIEGTTGAKFAKRYGARLLNQVSLDKAIEKMISGEAIAVTFDYPGLKYYMKTNENLDLQIISVFSETQNYGFCTSLRNPILKQLSLALLSAQESGKLKEILDRWGIN